MANRHEYDPLLRAWIYGGPGTEGFDHTAEGWNFWAGDMAMDVVGTSMGREPEEQKVPKHVLEAEDSEVRNKYWQEQATKNLSSEMKDYLEKGMEARRAAIKAGVI